ncbi:MAG: cysteine--tRNA ligase [Patescibacteria group bacterium]|nr:cysteine--tRNA ligase [Patescibacteria group bacterium]MDE2015626.1 cysteine--tRNA ligase [Patescibacteria group bacterium]MDE2226683.1 cysteine--tRNA ligase [Patescibacteria group bacterium]
MIKIYNTLTRKKEPLPEPQAGKPLKVFVCGPTVYDYAHIGHARTYIFFDFLAKYLRSQGYEVEYLQNITDVDDKIIKRAAEENKTAEELSKFFTEKYLEDMETLGVDAITNYAPATKFIPQIISQVERLIEKGFAYKIDGDGWYFDISKDKEYGKLSGRTATQAEDALSRIDESINKRNKGDFCLWKFSKPNEPVWPEKNLGDGRPGWHIEDTAITEKYFGPQYDIHGGGVDLVFPHHEAEMAQQESASGLKPFVKLWIHTGVLLVEGKKMSKSLGNFITIRDFLKKYPPDVLRWITLTHHYRSPIDYSDESARQAKSAIDGTQKFLAGLEFSSKNISEDSPRGDNPIEKKTDIAFASALADDINTPTAIAHIFNAILELQPKIWTIEPDTAKSLAKYLKGKFAALGFSFKSPEIPAKAWQLASERETFRVNKQFVQSDALRKEIDSLGYVIEDTPKGPFLWPKNQI